MEYRRNPSLLLENNMPAGGSDCKANQGLPASFSLNCAIFCNFQVRMTQLFTCNATKIAHYAMILFLLIRTDAAGRVALGPNSCGRHGARNPNEPDNPLSEKGSAPCQARRRR
jgi:hypothetical protein